MFPLFHITSFIEVHFFGFILVIAWMIFFWLLHKYNTEHGLSKNIFKNISLYTVSIFFWSRIFYIFSDWRNEKYLLINLVEWSGILAFLRGFFITPNYSLSLAGGIFGFLLIFVWYIYTRRANYKKNIDVLVRAFFWAAILGYLGALLGGQIYGIPFDSPFSMLYSDKNSIVPIGSARFPLPVIYIMSCLLGGLLIEKLHKSMTLPDGFLGYVGFGFYGIVLFLFEFTSGTADMFESYFPYLAINQTIGLIFIWFSLVWILKNIKL